MKWRLFKHIGNTTQRRPDLQVPTSTIAMELDDQQLASVQGAAGIGCTYDSKRHAYRCCTYDKAHKLHCTYRSHP